jgi:predicted nucleic acid-binding Zn ribbon protein
MRRSETQNISAIVRALLKQHGLEDKLLEHRLIKSWDDLLGKAIARHTKKLYIKDRCLFVSLDSSVVRNELMMIRDELIKRLNENTGAKVIDKIVLM